MIVWDPSVLPPEDRESFARYLEHAVRAAVAEEREACAKMADIEHADSDEETADDVLTRLAADIRARADA